MRIKKFQNIGKITFREVLKWIGIVILMVFFALFMDWVILNWLSRCCDGGVCLPDLYPQCRNINYDQIYGEGYYDTHRKAAEWIRRKEQIQKYEKGENRLSAGKLFLLSQAVDVPVQYFFPQDPNQRQESIPPQTVRVVRMLNRIPTKHYDDLTNMIRAILKIALNADDASVEKALNE
jgi:transcriptional regulator with XRE-family HTH domain